ncbi:MAG: PHP domain-containing protein, partial [Verrucomicrobia bacterium]|nr:PHP domain-containing protein [Verrucomicrobiota bacterium]
SNVYDGRFCSELPLTVSAQRQGAHVRLAQVLDGLRQLHGHSVVLRGHDLRLRDGPRELLVNGDNRQAASRARLQIIVRPKPITYVPLRCHSHYTFLDSTLSPEGIVRLAAEQGLSAVALTDTGNLHGAGGKSCRRAAHFRR